MVGPSPIARVAMAVRVMSGLVWSEASVADLFFDQRMVTGQLDDGRVPDQIGPAVADIQHHQTGRGKRRRCAATKWFPCPQAGV